jgi:pantothenate kinase-related protein Tda10
LPFQDYLEKQDSVNCHSGDPWIIFTVGAQGAGKHHTIDCLVKDERLRLLSFVFVDPGMLELKL